MADASSPTPPGKPPSSKEDAGGERDAAEQMTLWRLAGIGLELAMTVGVFAALGWWLDNKFGWTPWGLFGFAMLGVVAGLYRFIRTTMK